MELLGVPRFLQPRLRLFLSVDLVGSTALKQSGQFPILEPTDEATLLEAGAGWIHDLATFYRDIESKFKKEWETYSTTIAPENRWPTCDRARLWKINGDELIYVHELPGSREAVALLWCWLQSCKSFRDDLNKKKSKLDVKMTAWTAGFPVSNTEVIFETKANEEYADWDPITLHYRLIEKWYEKEGEAQGLIQDFIGPSLDTGFRLAAKSSPRKFVISLEAAYILAMTAAPSPMTMKIGYDGRTELKGVFGGKPYPVFWIDAHDDNKLSSAEDILTGSPHPQFGSIRTFCDEYILENEAYMFKPFIFGDPEPLLGEVPKHYEKKLLQIAAAWEKARENRGAYVGSLRNAAPPAVEGVPPAGTVEVRLPTKGAPSSSGQPAS